MLGLPLVLLLVAVLLLLPEVLASAACWIELVLWPFGVASTTSCAAADAAGLLVEGLPDSSACAAS